MKTAISLPDPLFRKVERLAGELHVSRSEFFADAAKAYIEQVTKQSVTERLNAVYPPQSTGQAMPKEMVAMQAASIPRDTW